MKRITTNILFILLLSTLLATQFFSCKKQKSDEELQELIIGDWEEKPYYDTKYRWIFDTDGNRIEFFKNSDNDSTWFFLYSTFYYIENGEIHTISNNNDTVSRYYIIKKLTDSRLKVEGNSSGGKSFSKIN